MNAAIHDGAYARNWANAPLCLYSGCLVMPDDTNMKYAPDRPLNARTANT
jgi:hypothetical protein